MILRADELANKGEIERDRGVRENMKKGLSTVAGLAASQVASPLASKILPLLSEYIPPALAMKGIEKISPKLGSFLKKGQEMGLDVQEGMNFIKNKIQPSASIIPEIKKVEENSDYIKKLFSMARSGKTQGKQFLKFASSLIKSGDIPDEETFSNFYKWWKAKPSAKRASPRAEFELFRNEIGSTLQPSKAALHEEAPNLASPAPEQPNDNGDQAILAALQKIMQM